MDSAISRTEAGKDNLESSKFGLVNSSGALFVAPEWPPLACGVWVRVSATARTNEM